MRGLQAVLRPFGFLRGHAGGRRGMAGWSHKSHRDSVLEDADFHVVIVGRPNVGKSSLLNRLTGRQLALVYDQPGVTRDTIQATCDLRGVKMRLTDTAGLDDGVDMQDSQGETRKRGPHIAASGIGRWPGHLLVAALAQTTRAVKESNLTLMVIDASAGVTPLDVQFARWLLKLGRPSLLLVNKSDRIDEQLPQGDIKRMGLGEPIYISATHSDGISELASLLRPMASCRAARESCVRPLEDPFMLLEDEKGVDKTDRMLRMCVMGRPNVGKSTMINKILERMEDGEGKRTQEEGKGKGKGEEIGRLLTGPEPGVTRDPVPVKITHKGIEMLLIDTAGLRRKAQVMNNADAVDIATSLATLREIKWCQVCVLLLDATEDQPLTHQDLAIANAISKEGKGVVLVLNKSDTLSDKRKLRILEDKDELLRQLADLGQVPFVLTSSKRGKGLSDMLDVCMATHGTWRKKLRTNQLNNWLSDLKRVGTNMSRRFPTPKFARQIDAGPPSIVITCRHPEKNTVEFESFLRNSLRKRFELHGVPINLIIRGEKEDKEKRAGEKGVEGGGAGMERGGLDHGMDDGEEGEGVDELGIFDNGGELEGSNETPGEITFVHRYK